MISSENEAREYISKFADQAAMERLEFLAAALIEENANQNLISKPSESEIWQRHIADSVQLLRFVPIGTWQNRSLEKWLDLGTGAGFPGLVIAALAPEAPVFLVESRQRRIEWLSRIVSEMRLESCKILGKRLEAIAPFPVTIITARAFAPLPKLLRLSAPFSTSATRFLLPKGRSASQELAELPESQSKMFHVEHSLTSEEAGIIVSN